MNEVILIGFAITIVFVARVYSFITHQQLREGLTWTRFPSLMVVPLALLLQPTAMCGAAAPRAGARRVQQYILSPHVCLFCHPRFDSSVFEELLFSGVCQRDRTLSVGDYFVGKAALAGHERRTQGSVSVTACCSATIRESRKTFFAFECALTACCGAMMGLAYGDTQCEVMTSSALAVLSVYLLFILRYRPYVAYSSLVFATVFNGNTNRWSCFRGRRSLFRQRRGICFQRSCMCAVSIWPVLGYIARSSIAGCGILQELATCCEGMLEVCRGTVRTAHRGRAGRCSPTFRRRCG